MGGAGALLAMAGGAYRAEAAEPLKIGLALGSAAGEVGWTKQHTAGAAAIQQALGDEVQISVIENVYQPQDAERVFRNFAVRATGWSTAAAFRTAPRSRASRRNSLPSRSTAVRGPRSLANLGDFEARYHEGMYLAGIAAGKATRSGKLGFIGGFPVPDIVGPANAFLLGAQSVKPDIDLHDHIPELVGRSRQGKGGDARAHRAGLRRHRRDDRQPRGGAGRRAKGRMVGRLRERRAQVRPDAPAHLDDPRLEQHLRAGRQGRHRRNLEAAVALARPEGGRREDGVRTRIRCRRMSARSWRRRRLRSRPAASGSMSGRSGTRRAPCACARARSLTEAEVRSINWLAAGMQGRLKG